MTATPRPDYERPPVVETILGVQFEPLPQFKNAHLGAFWKTLNTEEWPAVSDAPLLEPQFERFTESARWRKIGLQLKFSQSPSCRLQIKNEAGDRMIQLQNGRLHFNWLGQQGGDYPRYPQVREEFRWAMEQFTRFVTQENLGGVRANQWEVTYLNHIAKETVWNGPNDWSFFKPLGAIPSIGGIAHAESFDGEWHFVIPPDRGRLHVGWRHGLQSEPEQRELIVLTLTARGPIQNGEDGAEGVLDGLDLGREVIVRSFAKLMSESANQYWGLTSADD
jgi:uncharacterized protein (TIGR04255 family)